MERLIMILRLALIPIILPVAAVVILFILIYKEIIKTGGILRDILLTLNILGALLLIFSAVLFRQGNFEEKAYYILFFGTCLFCIPINYVSFVRIAKGKC